MPRASAEPGLQPTDSRHGLWPIRLTIWSSPMVLFSQHLDDHPLLPPTVPLPVEHPLPGTQVELAARDRHDHLVADREAAQVRGGVVLTGFMVRSEEHT